MRRSTILGTGRYLPEREVTNVELAARMDTSDAWIVQRTGIRARRHVDFVQSPMGASELGARAGARALAAAGLTAQDIDCIVVATLSPDRQFPGDGVSVQAKLDIPAGVPAFDLRNQCSGFVYGLQLADHLVRLGTYRHVLLVGAEVHSSGLDFTTRGRDVAVLFGDGAGAVVLGATDHPERGLLDVRVHADGRYADALQLPCPSSATLPRLSPDHLAQGLQFPQMQGREVFKHAVVRMPEVLLASLASQALTPADIDLMVVHQANLRIVEAVQKRLGVPDAKVFNNIMRYGNTTAASIPIALDEAVQEGRLGTGQLLVLAAFGAGFTWGAATIRWGI